jgi:hypothetical protein
MGATQQVLAMSVRVLYCTVKLVKGRAAHTTRADYWVVSAGRGASPSAAAAAAVNATCCCQ